VNNKFNETNLPLLKGQKHSPRLTNIIPKSSLGYEDFALRVTKTLRIKVLSGLTLTLEMKDLIPGKNF